MEWWLRRPPMARGHRQVRKCSRNTARSMSLGITPCRATTWPRCAAARKYRTAVQALYPCRSSAAAKPSRYGPLGPLRKCASIFDAEKKVSNMFVSVCDRPSVAEPTETQDRAVMESRSATIHRKMQIPARQLPITEFAHKARIVGDPFVRTVLTALDVSAERGSATGLDRRHDLQLVEAHAPGVGLSPRRPVGAKDVGDLERRPRHAALVSRAAFASSG